MIRFLSAALIALSLLNSSCESRRTRIDRKNLIPENELVPLLTDIYLTDGLIGMPRIIMKYPPIDSLSTYTNVIEKHGYTKEALDKTLKYYFVKNPKKLIKIYDRVLSRLSKMESLIQKELARSRSKTGNLWPGQDSYSFPDPDASDSTSFSLLFKQPGYYTLTFSAILFPDDQSLNPHLIAYSCNSDSLETGRRRYVKPVCYIKDGREHKYSVVFSIPPKTPTQIRGSLYESDNFPGEWGKHMAIQNISFVYSLVEL